MAASPRAATEVEVEVNGEALRSAAAAMRDGAAPDASRWCPPSWPARLARRAALADRCGAGRGYVVALDGAAHSVARDYCRDRMCPRCWARGASRREPIAAAIVAAAREQLGLPVAFVTLTRRPDSLASADPRASIAATRAIWRATRQRLRRHPGLAAGGLVRWEATWRRPDGAGPARCHVHAHVLALASLDDAAELADAWVRAATDAGCVAAAAGQDVQDVGDSTERPVTAYMLKYLAKIGDIPGPGTLALAAWAWRGQRVVEYWGACHGAALRASSPHRMATIADTCRRAVAAERARYTVVRIGELALMAGRFDSEFLAAVVAAVGADCQCWHPVASAGAALALAERDGPTALAVAAAMVAALPLTPTAAELLGLPPVPSQPARPHEDGRDGECDQDGAEREE